MSECYFYGPIMPEIKYSILFYSTLFYYILILSALMCKLYHTAGCGRLLTLCRCLSLCPHSNAKSQPQ